MNADPKIVMIVIPDTVNDAKKQRRNYIALEFAKAAASSSEGDFSMVWCFKKADEFLEAESE